MYDEIPLRLDELTKEHGVELLYACESGSRAWDIDSPDSDYDIRFIYKHDPEWYLSLSDKQTDNIVYTDGLLDFAGWDIRKTLRLAYKSNPGILEWLHSPIVYTRTSFSDELADIMLTFSAKALMHHYISLADNMVKEYWKPAELVPLKKYFYAIRPLLDVSYMSRNKYAMPPVNLYELLDASVLNPLVLADIDELILRKTHRTEKEERSRFHYLDGFICEGVATDGWGRVLANAAPEQGPDMAALQKLFLKEVRG